MKKHQLCSYLQLPFQFEEKKLVHDLALMIENQWIPHYNKSDYKGDWNVIPLYAKEGDGTNIFALNSNDSAIIETPIMKDCLYFREVIHHFKFPILSVRLFRLGVGAEIKPHRDYQLGYEDNTFRLHIPIATNDDVHFILDGERLQMQPGECWYTNVNYFHSVTNKGNSDRIHLVIDGERNTWSDELFFSLAPEESFIPNPDQPISPANIKRMIEELTGREEPGAKVLIVELQGKLDRLENIEK
ncbi:MAG: hypothetical protein ACI8P3_000655 [Saprospiraceae bacterium]|jgi:hypothetical protein